MFKQFLVLLLLAGSLMAAMDVNKASKDDLMSISGIGEKKAEAIIKHRKKHGKFKSIDDLKNVKGIGAAIIANIKKGKKKSTKKKSSSTTKKSTHSKKNVTKNKSSSKKKKMHKSSTTKKSNAKKKTTTKH